MVDLGLPPGASGASALDLNNNGWVVGYFDVGKARHAALWKVPPADADGDGILDALQARVPTLGLSPNRTAALLATLRLADRLIRDQSRYDDESA